jgi:uncharacterized RDD family membrane protein YckC
MSNRQESIPLSRRLRFLNFIVDSIGIYFLYWIVGYLTIFCFEKFLDFDFNNVKKGIYEEGNIGEIYRLLLASTFLFTVFSYYFTLEFYFQKTWGKIVTRSKVVALNEEKITFRNIFLRTICRFIPIDWISYIFSRNGLHDKLSKTKVISEE